MSGPTPSVQFSWDGPGALAGGDDGKALCWNNATGKFVLTAKAAAAHTHAPSDLSQGGASSGQVLAWNGSAWVATTPAAGVTDHGALTGLADDDHSIYALLAPAASTRNVIQPTGAAVIPLVVKGAASQSAALTTWQNSAGTNLLTVGAGGSILANTSLQLGGYGMVVIGCYWQPGVTFAVANGGASNVGLLVKGSASQTADLIQAQNSAGAIQFAIGAAGKMLTNQAVTNTNTPSGATARAMPFYDAAGTLLGYAPLYAAQW